MIAFSLPPFGRIARLVAIAVLACLMSMLTPGCETAEEWTASAVDAVPVSVEQVETVADTLDKVGVWVPDPGGWVVAASTSVLGLLALAMRRRAARKALLTLEGAREVVKSVDAVLAQLPPVDRSEVKQTLAAKQGDRGRALVAEVRTRAAA